MQNSKKTKQNKTKQNKAKKKKNKPCRGNMSMAAPLIYASIKDS